MEPRELSSWPETTAISEGDILTFDGVYNRPATGTLVWWLMLAFHPARVCRHFPWAFRRRITDPMSFYPITRRGLFAPRTLQTFKAKHPVTSA